MRILFFCVFCLFFSLCSLAQEPSIQWQACLGGSAKDSVTSIKQCSDGGYIVAGNTSSVNGDVSYNHGGADIWVLKLDPGGHISWEKKISALKLSSLSPGLYMIVLSDAEGKSYTLKFVVN